MMVFGFISANLIFITWSNMQNSAYNAAFLMATGQVTSFQSKSVACASSLAILLGRILRLPEPSQLGELYRHRDRELHGARIGDGAGVLHRAGHDGRRYLLVLHREVGCDQRHDDQAGDLPMTSPKQIFHRNRHGDAGIKSRAAACPKAIDRAAGGLAGWDAAVRWRR